MQIKINILGKRERDERERGVGGGGGERLGGMDCYSYINQKCVA